MSRDDVEVVRKAIAALGHGGPSEVLEYCEPSIEWVAPLESPGERIYMGHDGLRRAASVWLKDFEELDLELERALDVGERVIALLVQRGRVRGSDSEIEHRVSWDCELRDGKLARIHVYSSWEEALKAGPPEAG